MASSSAHEPVRSIRLSLVLAAIQEAISRGDGEVLVEEGDFRGAIHVHEGMIAWVRVSTELESVAAFFPDAPKADTRRLLELCRSTKANVFESAIALRLASRDEVRNRLRSLFRRRLNELLALTSPSVSFTPRKFTYGTDLRFVLDDLVLTPKQSYTRMRVPGAEPSVPPSAASRSSAPPRSGPPPLPRSSPPLPRTTPPPRGESLRPPEREPASNYDFEGLLSAALRFKGVAGASIVDLDAGRPVLVRGIGPAPAAIATYIAMPTSQTHTTPARLPAAGRSVAVFFSLPRSPHHVLAVVVLQGGAHLDELEMSITRAIRR